MTPAQLQRELEAAKQDVEALEDKLEINSVCAAYQYDRQCRAIELLRKLHDRRHPSGSCTSSCEVAKFLGEVS